MAKESATKGKSLFSKESDIQVKLGAKTVFMMWLIKTYLKVNQNIFFAEFIFLILTLVDLLNSLSKP